MEEVVGYETLRFLLLPLPQACCPKVMLSLSVATQDSEFFLYLREGGQLSSICIAVSGFINPTLFI